MNVIRTVIRSHRYPEKSFIEHCQDRRLTLIELTGEMKGDACRERLLQTAHHMEAVILSTPAWTVRELRIKLEVWTALISDPGCILEEHQSFYWDTLLEDISDVMDCLAGGDDMMLHELPLLERTPLSDGEIAV